MADTRPTAEPSTGPVFRIDEPPALSTRCGPSTWFRPCASWWRGQDQAREALEKAATPTWEGLAQPLAELAEPLGYAWNVVHHLLSVKNSPALREAEAEVQPEVVAAALRARAEPGVLRQASWPCATARAWAALSEPRRRIVESSILRGRAGRRRRWRARPSSASWPSRPSWPRPTTAVLEQPARRHQGLRPGAARARAEVAGLPASVLAAAAQSARENAGERRQRWPAATRRARAPGASPWRRPLYVPFMEHSPPARSARAALPGVRHPGLVGRAGQPAADRAASCALRREEARAAGLRLVRRAGPAAQDGQARCAAVEALLDELRRASRPARRARAGRADRVRPRSRAATPALTLALWDVRLLGRAPARAALRLQGGGAAPVFPAARRCWTGCSRWPGGCSGSVIAPADGEAPVWHPDVRYFRVRDEDGSRAGRRSSSIPTAARPTSAAAPGCRAAWIASGSPTAACACRWPTWSATRRRRSTASRR